MENENATIDFLYDNAKNPIYDYLTNIFGNEHITYNPEILALLVDQSWRIIARYKGIDPETEDYMPYFSAIAELTIAYFNNSLIIKTKINSEQQNIYDIINN